MKHFLSTICSVCIISIIGCQQPTETAPSEEEKFQMIEMVTSLGTIELQLYNETPLHRDNFINLTRHHAYDSVLFHRVIENFMIQSGDPDSKSATATDTLGNGDAPYKVEAEFSPILYHKKGVLAAARDGNPERASSGMQFYIVQGKVFNDSSLNAAEKRIHKTFAVDYFKEENLQQPLIDSLDSAMQRRNFSRYEMLRDSIYALAIKDENFKPFMIPEAHREVYKTIGGTPHLDQTYTVFGEVTKGLEVVDSIAAVATNSMDRPLKNVRILSMKLIQD